MSAFNDNDLWSSLKRRLFLRETAFGLGAIALGDLLSSQDSLAASAPASANPFAVKPPHFAPKAKRVIFIFMAGAPSQLDLFDPKPKMRELHGKPVPPSLLEGLQDFLIKGSATVMASPRTFTRYGQSGMDFSDYVPHLGSCADDWCMVRSVHTDVANHDPGQLLFQTGVPRFGNPCMGSWVTYGLGSESQNMPGFVVMLSNSGKGVDAGSSIWSNGFLPSHFRGVTFRSKGDAILNLSSPSSVTPEMQRARLESILALNRMRFEQNGDDEILSRIAAYELAFRMQTSAPQLLDFSQESKATLSEYGVDQETTRWFGTNCLLARRMVERGVRFVQLYHSTWDDHSDINKYLKINCDMTDQPAAALVRDLKRRGLLEETLVVWAGEFGRTPMNEVRRGNTPGREGRDHHQYAFTILLAGGGVKPGFVYGQTDELGFYVTKDKVHVHDVQATILHCLGMDHTKLVFRHQGRDQRLTDVAGNIVHEILA